MSDYVESHEVEQILQRHDVYAAAIQNDTRYSDSGKQELIEANRQASRQDAIALADKMLSEAAQALGAAQQRHNQEAQAWHEAIDPTRQMVAFRQADTLEYARDKETIARFVDAAVARGDVASLRAFETVAPKLLGKAGQTGAPYSSLDVHHLIGRTQEALANAEPETLKKARQGVETATEAARKLERTLASINERRSRNGGHGPLANLGRGTRAETYINPRTGQTATKFVATGATFF